MVWRANLLSEFLHSLNTDLVGPFGIITWQVPISYKLTCLAENASSLYAICLLRSNSLLTSFQMELKLRGQPLRKVATPGGTFGVNSRWIFMDL